MSILITGGHGLIGSSIFFGNKPTKEKLNLLNYGDLEKYIETHKTTKIIHMAAKVGGLNSNTKYVFDFFMDNLTMVLNVLKACQRFRLNNSIFLMSTCVFPKNCDLPLQEHMLHNGEPNNTEFGYAYAKRMVDVGIRALKQQYNLDSTCLIPCNLYGNNDNYNLENGHVIPCLIHRCYLAKKNNVTLEIWGSGNTEREFIYADDIANIITIISNNNLSIDGPMIISPGCVFTIKEIVEHIIRIMQFKGHVHFDSTKPEGILRKNSSDTKFKKYFPDFQFTSLNEGLGKTIEYFLSNYRNIRQ